MFRHALNLGFGTRSSDTWVTSTDQTQAGLLVEDVIWCADLFQLGGFGDRLIKSVSQDCVLFSNGNRLHSLSSNPNAQAGKRGNRVIDEFALHEQQEKLLAIAMPGTDWSGDVEIFSTPRGTDKEFHRLMMEIEHNDNPRGFSYYKYTLQNFLDEGGLYKIQCALPHNHHVQQMDEAQYFDYKRRECGNEETFNQEYMCISTEEATAFLSYDLITAAEYQPQTGSSEAPTHSLTDSPTHAASASCWSCDPSLLSKDSELYIGVDIGRDKDLTVIWSSTNAAAPTTPPPSRSSTKNPSKNKKPPSTNSSPFRSSNAAASTKPASDVNSPNAPNNASANTKSKELPSPRP